MSRITKAILVFGLIIGSANARPPSSSDPDLAPWFRSLHNKAMSCCDQSDGHILGLKDWRQTNQGFEIKVGDNWIQVPSENIVNTYNPTGGAVAFFFSDHPLPQYIYCFIPPFEG